MYACMNKHEWMVVSPPNHIEFKSCKNGYTNDRISSLKKIKILKLKDLHESEACMNLVLYLWCLAGMCIHRFRMCSHSQSGWKLKHWICSRMTYDSINDKNMIGKTQDNLMSDPSMAFDDEESYELHLAKTCISSST